MAHTSVNTGTWILRPEGYALTAVRQCLKHTSLMFSLKQVPTVCSRDRPLLSLPYPRVS